MTISNEYTDWTRSPTSGAHSAPSQHPVSIIDSLNEVLGDALIVSPLIRTGLIHTSSIPSSGNNVREKGRTFFYNFAFSAPNSNLPPPTFSAPSSNEEELIQSHNLKCLHGHELPFLFGHPLIVDNGNHANNKINRIEVNLSENLMTYFSNFVKFGCVQLLIVRISN